MFMQSAAMALGFGSFFQYGKRKISSMSNEEFNKLTPEDLTSQLMSSVNNMIPTVHESFHQMEQMNVMILEAMSKYFSQGVEFLDKWIIGRGENFISNLTGAAGTGVDNSETQYLQDFGIGAAADEGRALSGGGTQQKFANDYEREAMRLGFKLLLQIVKTFGTRTDIPVEKRVGYLAAFKKLEQIEKDKIAARDTPAEGIAKSGATGVALKIANDFNRLKIILRNYIASRSALHAQLFRTLVSKFNIMVQSTRKPDGTTYRSMSINADKSLVAKKIIPKF